MKYLIVIFLHNYRYVHIGPYLSMRLVKNIDSDPLIHEIYHLLNINSNITLLLCTNELNHCKVVPKFTNILLINYDFQVNIKIHFSHIVCFSVKLNSFCSINEFSKVQTKLNVVPEGRSKSILERLRYYFNIVLQRR